MKDQTKEQYKALIKKIKKYNKYYYENESPLVDDKIYDKAMQELLKIENENPGIIDPESPSKVVGGNRSEKFSSVKHEPPMLSLSNVFNANELKQFDDRVNKFIIDDDYNYFAELKYDGLAVEIVYKNGLLVEGSTRGNGLEGENITENIKTLGEIPLKLNNNPPPYLSVRGEVYMSHSEFERLNKERELSGEALFANPRNAASGSLRQLDADITKKRNLSIKIYAIGRLEGHNLDTQLEMFEYLGKLGFPVSNKYVCGNIDEIIQYYHYWEDNRYSLNYDIDGVVVKINQFDLRDKVGVTSKYPKWATAWKFPAEEAITQIESVEYSVGRTGIVTPVANLRPINIGGVLVKRATLHNFNEIKRLGIKINDYVKIIRAGDVIPKILEVLVEKRGEDLKEIDFPDKCPDCGDILEKEDVYLRCTNIKCPSIIFENLKFFVSKEAMDFENFGPELINRLLKNKKIFKISDIFKITKNDLLELDRMGDKLADKIINSIENRKKIPLWHLLRSLGIRNVGDHIAKVITKELKSLDNLLKADRGFLMGIHEIGPNVADAIFNFFHNSENIEMLKEMQNNGLQIIEEQNFTNNLLFKDMIIVFTGSLTKLTRKQAEDIVEKNGGRATSSVSKNTSFVVIGENPGSKYINAKNLGIKIISEQEFLDMMAI